jgi:mono/diheme cytochrome c family protein/glucose/arabinose dehydrogenase
MTLGRSIGCHLDAYFHLHFTDFNLRSKSSERPHGSLRIQLIIMTQTIKTRSVFMSLAALTLGCLPAGAADWLLLPAKPGTSNGKKIVLISGDEEYRSEESCPMLAKILSQKHGFDCVVLFAINPDGGYIDPNFQKNIPGTAALDSADLMIIGTRFRQLPNDQIANFGTFLDAGKPVIGFRTATHAFSGSAQTGTFKWADFGLNILGEKWVNHHGTHQVEGTRSFIEGANSKHEILSGVGEIFGDSDVYGIANLDQSLATILLRGAVTETLDVTSQNLAGKKNNPMMPIAWLREYTAPNAATKGKAFCTTMGSSTDFADEDLRRLVVNAAFYLTGQKVPAKADVGYIDPFSPTSYSAISQTDFYKNLNRKPSDYGLGKSPATGLPGEKPDAALPDSSKKNSDPQRHAPHDEPAITSVARPQMAAPPSPGERIVFIGNGLAERDLYYGQLETEIHLRNPDKAVIIRNMGRPGDTPGFRPHPARKSQWAFPEADKFHPDKSNHSGNGFFSTPDQWLTHLKADTILAFFGYNESFDGPEKVDNYEAELDAFVRHTLSKAYNGNTAPRLVLVSPIAFEDLSKTKDLPDGTVENANLKLYTAAMERVAKKHSLTFVDLFTPTREIFAKTTGPFTTSGFIPNEAFYQEIASLLATGAFGTQPRSSKADLSQVLAAIKQKNWFWQNDYNILNGVHSHGGRYEPYGPQNYPDEIQKTREMLGLRDILIQSVASGKTNNISVDDSKTHPLPPVETNYKPNNKTGSPEYLYGRDAEKSLTVPNGYRVEMFASEKEFPNLANPVQLSFDDRGRLWVATMPTYPAYRPGDRLPDDKILIYEDTDNDGRADREIVFADRLHLPIGFEFAPEGVYVAQEPNLILMRDTNGDDRADVREIVLSGFDTHDTHHAISAFCADPSGSFLMGEGIFLHSNVETAYGPIRAMNGGFFRYNPARSQLERTAQLSIPNPWGIAFDKWGQDFFLHTSGSSVNWMLPASSKPTYGSQSPSSPDLAPSGNAVRPTSGLEFVSSRHFPDEVQGDMLLCNNIGFLGIKQHSIVDDGTGYKTEFRQDLLKSTDGNFRPVDLEFAPDGSLYVVDWHNALIGHMQHNARDPLRDHVHGRIYRITYPSRPLVKPAQVEKAPVATLLENLKLPEYRTRYRSRRELRSRPVKEVLPAVKAWVSELDSKSPHAEHAMLEALWTTWGLNEVDETLLRQLLEAPDFHVRAAAVRVLRYNIHRIADHAALLEKAAVDVHGRVRLEAIIAGSWLNNSAGKKIVSTAASQPLDVWNENAAKTAQSRLAGLADAVVNEHPLPPIPTHLTADEQKQFIAGHEIYFRDAHCATCHQADGKGIEPAFPPLANSEWVIGNPDRIIKLTLHGMMGPFVLNGKKYDGLVPMTAFGGMLDDVEVAAVLTYVRNNFGNKAPAVNPAEVTAVRAATKDHQGFYQALELQTDRN